MSEQEKEQRMSDLISRSALIEAGGFDASAAGYIASAQVFGIATTNLAAVILGNRFNWRALCLIGLCV